MFSQRFRIGSLVASLALATVVVGATVPAAFARPAASPVIGHVYVDDNTTGVNTIAAFAEHANGSLTALHGSPFAAGGQGTGTVVASQGPVQVALGGRYLLAADAGSNQISVLSIHSGGSLSLTGHPVWSGGVEPLSIAVHGHLVYVANNGNGTSGANYTGFWLSDDGRLAPIAASTFGLSASAGPGQVLFNGTGTRLVGVEVGPSLIDSFVVTWNGTLGSHHQYAAQAAGPFGSEFRPTNPSQLFISNAHAGTGNGSVSAYRDGAYGVLTSIGNSPYADQQTAPCWLTITPNGRDLYAVNTGSGSLSTYAIANDGTLKLLGSTILRNAGTGSLKAFELGVDKHGWYAYNVETGVDALDALAITSNGTLTELRAFALPTGAVPFGVAITW